MLVNIILIYKGTISQLCFRTVKCLETFSVSYLECVFDHLKTDCTDLLSEWKFCLIWKYSIINNILHGVSNERKMLHSFPNVSLYGLQLSHTFYVRWKKHLSKDISNMSKSCHILQNWKNSRIWVSKLVFHHPAILLF